MNDHNGDKVDTIYERLRSGEAVYGRGFVTRLLFVEKSAAGDGNS
jgi:hypothetical protein